MLGVAFECLIKGIESSNLSAFEICFKEMEFAYQEILFTLDAHSYMSDKIWFSHIRKMVSI